MGVLQCSCYTTWIYTYNQSEHPFIKPPTEVIACLASQNFLPLLPKFLSPLNKNYQYILIVQNNKLHYYISIHAYNRNLLLTIHIRSSPLFFLEGGSSKDTGDQTQDLIRLTTVLPELHSQPLFLLFKNICLNGHFSFLHTQSLLKLSFSLSRKNSQSHSQYFLFSIPYKNQNTQNPTSSGSGMQLSWQNTCLAGKSPGFHSQCHISLVC